MDYYGPMPLSSRLLAAPLLAFSLTAAAAPALDAKPAASVLSLPSTAAQPARGAELDAELFYEIFLGELSLREGDPGAAYGLMLEAARRSKDESLYKRATDIALQSRSGEAALAAARAWETAWPKSHDAQRYLLQILLVLNRTADTAAVLPAFLDSADPPALKGLVLSLPLLYQRVSDKALATAVVTKALESRAHDPALATASLVTVGRMHLLQGNTTAALESARRVVALDPKGDDAALLALDLFEAKAPGSEAMAQEAFAHPHPPSMQMAYAKALLDAQRYAQAKTQLVAMTRAHPELPQPWLALAALQVQNGESEAAQASLAQYETAMREAPASAELRAATAQTYLLQSEIAEKRGRLEEAENWLSRIDDAAIRTDVQIRRASLLARQGKLAHARALVEGLPGGTPQEQRRKRIAEVQLLRAAGQYPEAYALQSQLVQQSPEDADLQYDQAMLAEKMGDHAAMERILRGIIAAKPDFHHAYNALGFSFAERGVHLAEARTLVETALRLAPNDPFITDSLAWVEFRTGNHARALQLLATAFADRKDAEIAAHYGEVLWVTGEREQARAIWKKALRTDAENPTLQETLKRLGVTP